MKIILLLLCTGLLFGCKRKPAEGSISAEQCLREDLAVKKRTISAVSERLSHLVSEDPSRYAKFYDMSVEVNKLFDSILMKPETTKVDMKQLKDNLFTITGRFCEHIINNVIPPALKTDNVIVRENVLRNIQCYVLLALAYDTIPYSIHCGNPLGILAHIVPEKHIVKSGQEYRAYIGIAGGFYAIDSGEMLVDSIFRDGVLTGKKVICSLKDSHTRNFRMRPDKPGNYHYKGYWTTETPEGPRPVRFEGSFTVLSE